LWYARNGSGQGDFDMTTPFRLGAEFLINTTVAGNQNEPAITALADGRFLVVWTDASQTGGDTSGNAIRAQLFSATGTKLGAAFLVNTTVTNGQQNPAITALADGRFVVAWSDDSATGGDSSGAAVRAQVFNPDGSRSGAEFVANTTVTGPQYGPAITGLGDGRFVATWTDGNGSTGGSGSTYANAIRGQVFNGDGSRTGGEFLLDTEFLTDQRNSSVTLLGDGRLLVTWWAGENGRVYAQLLDANGVPSADPVIVAEGSVAADRPNHSVTALPDGRFVVVFSEVPDPSFPEEGGDDTWAQVFNSDASRAGPLFRINSTLAGEQYRPSITALADGRFVAVWTDASTTGGDRSGLAIRAQVFNADGTKSGTEFLVNTIVTGNQDQPSVTALADGRLMVSWVDFSAGSADIRGQIFDPRLAAISLNGTLAADEFVGTIFADRLGGFFGDDTLSGGAGDDVISGGLGLDLLNGGSGNDQIEGGDGDDRLSGGNGSDGLFGGAGSDTLNGGFGADAAAGGAGNDSYLVDLAGDLVIEAADEGTDRVQSSTLSLDLATYANVEDATLNGALDLDLTGSAAANRLAGNAGGNRIAGGDGNDTLDGGAGVDTLVAGLGQDRLTGGADEDIFIFTSALDVGNGPTRDRITDFTPGQDLLFFQTFMASGSFIGSANFTATGFAQLRYVSGTVQGDQNGDGTLDFSLRLDGAPALTAADVLL
jgi:Ca2+-binding RTX toxin-like protein